MHRIVNVGHGSGCDLLVTEFEFVSVDSISIYGYLVLMQSLTLAKEWVTSDHDSYL